MIGAESRFLSNFLATYSEFLQNISKDFHSIEDSVKSTFGVLWDEQYLTIYAIARRLRQMFLIISPRFHADLFS